MHELNGWRLVFVALLALVCVAPATVAGEQARAPAVIQAVRAFTMQSPGNPVRIAQGEYGESIEGPPVVSEPIEGLPVENAPVGGPPVGGGPVEDDPVEDATLEGGPVEDPPVESAPLEGGPVESGPVEGETVY